MEPRSRTASTEQLFLDNINDRWQLFPILYMALLIATSAHIAGHIRWLSRGLRFADPAGVTRGDELRLTERERLSKESRLW